MPYDAKFDLNKDGIVDQKDLEILERIIVGLVNDPTLVAQADFNGDGRVNVLDITTLERYIADNPPPQPHVPPLKPVFTLQGLLPMSPRQAPPLPSFLQVFWPSWIRSRIPVG